MFTAYFDSGTSNTRLYLLDENFKIVAFEKAKIGSKDAAIQGDNKTLIASMKRLYDGVLKDCGLADQDVETIYASGMVTSPYGLEEVPHLQVPIDLKVFTRSLCCHLEEQAFHRRIFLVPGLKTGGRDLAYVNNMRGEEIQVIGAMEDLREQAAGLEGGIAVILPGSHTHVAYVKEGEIRGLLSNFNGELFHALKTATILAPVLAGEGITEEELDEAMVKKGYSCLSEFGFNRAIYMAHAMRIFQEGSPRERFSFGEGVINGGIRQSVEYYCRHFWKDCRAAAVLGNSFMYRLYSFLFQESPLIEKVLWLPDSEERPYSVKGLARIADLRRERNKK